jgi:hypothetical protein
MRTLALFAGTALLLAAVLPTYPVESMALWIPGAALILTAIYGPKENR